MNKLIASMVLSGASVFLSCNALASPNTIQIGFSCPTPSGNVANGLSNFGWCIAGYGEEFINGALAPNSPYFSYSYTTGNFPSIISAGGYTVTSIEYDPVHGVVSCAYTSSSGFEAFVANYQMTNGAGGVVANQTTNSIVINQYVGLI